jgi:hypothetical protein
MGMKKNNLISNIWIDINLLCPYCHKSIESTFMVIRDERTKSSSWNNSKNLKGKCDHCEKDLLFQYKGIDLIKHEEETR